MKFRHTALKFFLLYAISYCKTRKHYNLYKQENILTQTG